MDAKDLFKVETVEIAAAPASALAGDTATPAKGSWCRYVIANRSSRVVGRFRGTLAQTRRNAEQLASSFNERAQTNRSVWTPRSQVKRKTPARGKAAAAR